ncbi:G/U mismatch-specific DNA glycosylase [Burkholderia gladioli]|uniref:G/U mismatch-specific DNA glycosylase n=1 Tax=Burkholderia gladioli TaxID=28095 RepID=UPI00163E7A29|nr:G/U mismatch-specific DNA glycosylase [Burkholderia gladioli]MBU9269427.1 G/U mismatch-specific DNA glycosylase [Burkholderia gladioli]
MNPPIPPIPLSPFDVLLPGLPVVFCGINPSPLAAQSGHNFGSASNRFWPALHRAGFTAERLRAEDDRALLREGCGITAMATRATRRANDLAAGEMSDAVAPFRAKIAYFRPGAVAFLGKPAYAAIAGRREIEWGEQPERFEAARAWVLPNPSGLNRAFTLDRLVEAYAALRLAMAAELAAWRLGQEDRDCA